MSLDVFPEGVSESECVSGLTKREEAGGEEEEAEASNECQGHNIKIWESSCCRKEIAPPSQAAPPWGVQVLCLPHEYGLV